MRCRDVLPRSGEFEELLGQPHVDPLERDLLDEAEEVGDAAAERGEDELAEFARAGDQPVEQRAGHGHGTNPRLRDALGLIVFVTQQAGSGQRAAFASLHAVKHDLAAGFRGLLHANGAVQQQQEGVRRLTGAEDAAALGQLDDQAGVAQLNEELVRQLSEQRKCVGPILCAINLHRRIRPSSVRCQTEI